MEIKLLLLGAGESGKTTFMKQMKIINLNGYTDQEKSLFYDVIQSNIKTTMVSLVQIALKQPSVTLLPESLPYTKMFTSAILQDDRLSPELVLAVETLWRDPTINKLSEQHNMIEAYESMPYFISDIRRIAKSDYIPTITDILKCRARTVGINELIFPFGHMSCRLIDVGGQRSERRKWIHCFQSVTSILFFVALSEYDQVLQETAEMNRMHESLKLFEQMFNGRWFLETGFILLFNKDDLFRAKIVKTDLNVCFPEYNGGCDYNNALEFIKNKFLSLNKTKRMLYSHVTCSTDTDQIKKVYFSIRETILDNQLQTAGLI